MVVTTTRHLGECTEHQVCLGPLRPGGGQPQHHHCHHCPGHLGHHVWGNITKIFRFQQKYSLHFPKIFWLFVSIGGPALAAAAALPVTNDHCSGAADGWRLVAGGWWLVVSPLPALHWPLHLHQETAPTSMLCPGCAHILLVVAGGSMKLWRWLGIRCCHLWTTLNQKRSFSKYNFLSINIWTTTIILSLDRTFLKQQYYVYSSHPSCLISVSESVKFWFIKPEKIFST